MTYIEYDEPIVSAVVTQLNTNLAAAITAINALHTDGGTIGTPTIFDYIPTPRGLNSYPAIGVRTGEGALTDDTGGGGTWHTRVIIVCFTQDGDQRRLSKRLRRLTAAVANTAYPKERKYPDLASPIWGMRDLRFEPGPTLNRNEDPRDWMSYAALSFEVMVEADQA